MGIEEAIKNELLRIGKAEGKVEAVKNLLRRNFSNADIMDIMGVDLPFIEQVKKELA